MRKELVLTGILCLMAVAYAGYRAHFMSMTMDECGTFHNHVSKSIFYTLSYARPDANNHILNTLLIKASTSLFGSNSLTVRLPNVLALLLYLFFGWKLLQRLPYRPLFLLLGFCFLFFNPYQFDFFTVGRGYGLAMGFMMASIYYWLSFLEEQKLKYFSGAFAMAILSVFSNFVWLNYFVSLLACMGFWYLSTWVADKKAPRLSWILFVLLFTILLIILVGVPLYKLTLIDEFKKGFFGKKSFWDDTFHHLFHNYAYKNPIFPLGRFTEYLKTIVPLVLLLQFGYVCFMLWIKKSKESIYVFAFHIQLLIILISASTIVQHWLLGTNFLSMRTAIIYYPLLAVSMILLFSMPLPAIDRWSKWIYPILILFLASHFFKTHIPNFVKEWYYSSDTKSVVLLLNELNKGKKEITLGTHWRSSQVANFYIKTLPNNSLKWIPWETKIRDDDFYDYYYVPNNETQSLHPDYEVVQKYLVNVLYQHKRMRKE